MLVLVAGGLVSRYLGEWLRPRVENAVNEECRRCGLGIGSLRISLLPPRATLGGVVYHDGNPADSAIELLVESVTVPIPLANAFGGAWRLGVVEVNGLSVVVHEGDAHFPKKNAEPGNGKGFELAGVLVHNGEFTYRKDSPAGGAYLRVHAIEASGGPLGTDDRYRDQPLDAHADARLEESGAVNLTIAAKFFSDSPHADVDLHLDGLNLAEVNPYFRVEEGVVLSGKLLSSRSLVKVRGGSAVGDVTATFAGLGLKVHANRHRGGLSALLDNIGVKIKVLNANQTSARKDREKEVVTRRHPRESVVSFILRTMREGALRIAAP
ncbi:MAG: hypothetical protein ACXWBL_17440 [Usitatibacter sp.]